MKVAASVTDNGLSFIAIAEIAGPYCTRRPIHPSASRHGLQPAAVGARCGRGEIKTATGTLIGTL